MIFISFPVEKIIIPCSYWAPFVPPDLLRDIYIYIYMTSPQGQLPLPHNDVHLQNLQNVSYIFVISLYVLF